MMYAIYLLLLYWGWFEIMPIKCCMIFCRVWSTEKRRVETVGSVRKINTLGCLQCSQRHINRYKSYISTHYSTKIVYILFLVHIILIRQKFWNIPCFIYDHDIIGVCFKIHLQPSSGICIIHSPSLDTL